MAASEVNDNARIRAQQRSSTQRGAVPGDNYGPIQTIIAADMGAMVDNGRKAAGCNALLSEGATSATMQIHINCWKGI